MAFFKPFPKKSSKMTDAKDDRMDKKAGIKEGSKKDKALDKKRGVPEDDAPMKRGGYVGHGMGKKSSKKR